MRSSCKKIFFKNIALPFLFSLTVFAPVFNASSTENLDAFSPGALTTGLGQSGVVNIYDPSALYWNPAALAVRHYPQGALSIHEPYYANYLGGSFFSPRWGSFAATYGSTSSDSSAVHLGGLGWAYEIAPGFYGGLGFSRVQQRDAVWGTLGVGLLFKPESSQLRPTLKSSFFRSPLIMDHLTLGLAIQNLPLGAAEFEHQIRVGASYKFLQSGPTLVYAHHFMPNNDSDHLGVLITPTAAVSIFAGLKNFDSKSATFGLGYQWQNMKMDVSFDRDSKRLIFSTSMRIGRHPRVIAADYYDSAFEAVKQKEKRVAMRLCKYSLVYDDNNKKAADLLRLLGPLIEQENIKIDSLLHAALSYQNQQRFLDAAAQYLKILKIDANNAEAIDAIAMIRPKVNVDAERWYVQAVDFYDKGDISRASEIFESIILVRPDHFGSKNYLKKINTFHAKQAEQHYFAGLGYYSQHKLDQAEAEFRKALVILPNYEDASNYLSRIAQARAQSRNQISDLQRQAEEKESQGAWKSARALYEEILNIQPDHAHSLSKIVEIKRTMQSIANQSFTRGLSAFNAGDMTAAEQHFRNALSMQSNHANARRYLQKIASTTTDKTTVIIEQAQNALARGDWRQAIIFADSTLVINPNLRAAGEIKTAAEVQLSAEKSLRTAQNYYDSGQYLEAMQELDLVLKKNATHEQARNLLQECQQKLYNRVDDYFSRGIELYTEERYQEAIRMWDIVLRINPFHQGALDYHKRAQERIEALESLP